MKGQFTGVRMAIMLSMPDRGAITLSSIGGIDNVIELLRADDVTPPGAYPRFVDTGVVYAASASVAV